MLSNTTGLQYCLKIAIRFAAMRQQFGKPGEPESSLIEYPLHQYRLFPYAASAFVYMLGGNKILTLWGKNQKQLLQPNNKELAEVHALVSVMKSMASWNALEGAKECRSACGGLGYSYYSRFGFILNNLEIQ